MNPRIANPSSRIASHDSRTMTHDSEGHPRRDAPAALLCRPAVDTVGIDVQPRADGHAPASSDGTFLRPHGVEPDTAPNAESPMRQPVLAPSGNHPSLARRALVPLQVRVDRNRQRDDPGGVTIECAADPDLTRAD